MDQAATLTILTLLLAEPARSAVTYYTTSRILGSDQSVINLDLDGDSVDDLQIDVSAVFNFTSDPFFLATTFGSASIAATGGITRSFSVGDLVQVSSLAFVSSPGGLLTGGVYYDALGNVASEGWGGCSYDAFGNLMCPPGGPTNQVDLFLVDLGDDLAWVDIDSSSFSAIAGRIDFSWGLLESPADSFQITGMPEPGLPALVAVGLGVSALRRRRRSNKT